MHNHGIAVLVGDHTGQPVGFGMDQAQPLLAAQLGQSLAARHGGGDATLEKSVVHGLFRIEGPEAGADLRFRAVCRAPQRTQVVGQHLDRIARPRAAFEASDRTGKQPWVMLLERGTFLTRHENQLCHVFFDLKCKKPRLPWVTGAQQS